MFKYKIYINITITMTLSYHIQIDILTVDFLLSETMTVNCSSILCYIFITACSLSKEWFVNR